MIDEVVTRLALDAEVEVAADGEGITFRREGRLVATWAVTEAQLTQAVQARRDDARAAFGDRRATGVELVIGQIYTALDLERPDPALPGTWTFG